MNTIGWKVVRKNSDGSLQSAVDVKEWLRPYAIGSRTTGRDGTPLLAFRTRAAARRFRPHAALAVYPLFKAELENPRPQELIAPPWVGTHYQAFWDGSLIECDPAPPGTLACDAITLLEPA